jgi:basic amino acid/polyamine antiporter, APA family
MAVNEAVPEAMAGVGGEGLFVRKSSGFVREMGVRDSFGISLGILLLLGVFSGVAIFMQAFPNADLYVPILVGAVVSLALALTYTQLVGTFPRAGGEYIYASRVFTPVIGAAVGGAVLIAVCLNSANTVVQLGQVTVPFMFTTIGQALHVYALETFGSSTLVHKAGWLAVGAVVIGAYVAISLRPIGGVARWIFWSFIAGIVAYFAVLILLVLEGHGGFVHDFNAASNGGNAYHQIIAKSQTGGFHPGIHSADVIAFIPLGALIFAGFTFSNYAAGEIKRPLGTYRLAVLAALTAGLIGALLGWAALRHTVGLHFMQASSSLSVGNPAEYGKLTPVPAIQGGLAYGIIASGDPVTKIAIAVGGVLGWAANGLAYFALCSRIVFALSFDRLLPTTMADVRERTHAPVHAIALVALGVAIFTVLGDLTSLLTIFRNLILVAYALFVIGSICAMLLPYRRPELFAASPKVFQGRVLGIPVVSIVAAISALAFVALDVDIATKTQYSGGYSTSSIITIVAVATIGIVLYAVSRVVNARRGIDLRLAMHELPPE